MTWVKLADDFYDHPKVVAAGPLATFLWTVGLAYSNRYLTDGYLSAAVVRRLADVDDPLRLAARLVEVGLWERTEGGFTIHDFAEYQPSAEAVREERRKNAERVKRWRKRGVSQPESGGSNGVTYGVSPGTPDPVPVPYPDPDPAGATPQPPPLAEGELTPPTAADVELWEKARALATDGMLPANAERIEVLEIVGRAGDGGLRLRAPPGWGEVMRFGGAVRASLFACGDAGADKAVILTGGA